MDELRHGSPSDSSKGESEGQPVFIGNLDKLYKVTEEQDTDDNGEPFIITIKQ